jgi:hypothetical protein
MTLKQNSADSSGDVHSDGNIGLKDAIFVIQHIEEKMGIKASIITGNRDDS